MFKLVEQHEDDEKHLDQKSKLKFRTMSLKVHEGTDYIPEMLSLASCLNSFDIDDIPSIVYFVPSETSHYIIFGQCDLFAADLEFHASIPFPSFFKRRNFVAK